MTMPYTSKRWGIALFMIALTALAPTLRAQTIANGVYTLVSNSSSLLVDNQGSTTNGGAAVQHDPGSGNTNQEWQITNDGTGKYTLVCLTSGLALDTGSSTTPGGAVVTNMVVSSSTSQQWMIESAGSGIYQIVNVNSGNVLDNDGSTTSGSTLTQQIASVSDASQQWKFKPVVMGATTPFTTYEAESATLGGGASVLSLTTPPTNEFSSPPLEASGHSYVNLAATGQSVTFTNNTGKNITAINVRYSIPDSSGGGGISSTLDLYVNGQLRQALPVNSVQTWVYESSSNYNGMDQVPSDGNPHVFWDEVHAFISGAAVAPGSTITLQKDSANSAAYYNVDLVELEVPPAPLTQPTNSLSITANCGVVANSPSVDSTAKIQTCINMAQSQGQSIWIPSGTFYLTSGVSLSSNGVTISGAGPWYSVLYSNPTLPAPSVDNIMRPTGGTLQNFAIDGNAVSRLSTDGDRGAINVKGNNWVMNNLWIQHTGAAIWGEGTGGLVENCRINNTWADGINLNNGNGATGNNEGNNLTARNNFVRGTGDDGIAINDGSAGNLMNTVTVINNTSVAPWWSNNIGIYGGENLLVSNNLVMDSVKQYGISVGVFTTNEGPLESARVEGNTVLRGGSNGYGYAHGSIGVGIESPSTSLVTGVSVSGNTSVNAMFDGVQVHVGTDMLLNNNTVDAPGTIGFRVDSAAMGSAVFTCNTAENLNSGQPGYSNQSTGTNFSASGSCNIGFAIP